ncbi:hypothetical protein ACFPOI_59975 [Nonomuraea angiospora]|uniref:Uncharacterized protein n=1 Tax=Nonomuraea angiospora TaxID=46172 RepID=A0ABR9LQ20_9ACTN|nr:hypothetical protein [Nonomuraea angiospora]MBE1582757.1 hypothetical protein [Nonomuraea angiospora]
MATAAADLPLLLYRFHIAFTGGMSVGMVTEKLAETAEHVGEFAREFCEQNYVDVGEDKTADRRNALTGMEAAAATFPRAVDLIV